MVPVSVLSAWMSSRSDWGASRMGSVRLITPTVTSAGCGSTVRNRRGEIRRAVYMGCRARRMTGKGLVGDRSLDLSPQGMFLLSDESLPLGTELFVSFQATDFPIWFDTQATVARIVAGRRLGDDGHGFGLRFRGLPWVSRVILRGHLRKEPRPAPQRWPIGSPMKKDPDYASLVRNIMES